MKDIESGAAAWIEGAVTLFLALGLCVATIRGTMMVMVKIMVMVTMMWMVMLPILME